MILSCDYCSENVYVDDPQSAPRDYYENVICEDCAVVCANCGVKLSKKNGGVDISDEEFTCTMRYCPTCALKSAWDYMSRKQRKRILDSWIDKALNACK